MSLSVCPAGGVRLDDGLNPPELVPPLSTGAVFPNWSPPGPNSSPPWAPNFILGGCTSVSSVAKLPVATPPGLGVAHAIHFD